MNRNSLHDNGKVLLLCLALIAAGVLHGQTPQIPPNASALAQQCAGPLGALIPECQAAKNSLDIPSLPNRTGPAVAPAVKVPGSTDPVGRPAVEPVAPEPATPPRAQPPSEFQRFVASSVGQVLPIFGASLFDGVPSTFAPLDRVPVTADYALGPGDEILLRVWGQVNMDLDLPVDRSGAVFIPQVGKVNVAGLQFRQATDYLRAQIDRVYRNFDLNVNMGQLRSIQIFVVGQVHRPGTYTVSSLSTLVNALFASGGPSAQGSMRRIQLKRGAQAVTEFDLYDLLLKGDKSKDERLLPGDVVYVPPVAAQVAVAGSVKNPGIYELKDEATAASVIQMAGGLSAVADAQRATLERIKQRSSREMMEFQLNDAGLATPVADGDVLNILTILPRFNNIVTLRGNVASPGRFPWRAGMRLRDVIPDKESLVTRDYWKKKNLLGFTAPDERLAAEPAAEARRKPAPTVIDSSIPEINWSYAVIERQKLQDLQTELISFHLGHLVLENDETQNLELRPGDVVTIFSQADIRVPMIQQNRRVRLEGEFNVAGIYNVRPGETLGQLIERTGGLTPHAYLFGAEFIRETTRADQQRRLDQFVRELERDVDQASSVLLASATTPEEAAALATRLESERRFVERMRTVQATGRIVLNLRPDQNSLSNLKNLPLEDGDRLVVPARPATVNVFGAVYNQNSFVYDPGLRVKDYLRQAGGPTRNADKGRIFVIRADGSVVPKQGFGLFSRSFEATSLHPGDSVVVPQQMFKSSFMRGLRDWTQVFSQMALGAAAINVLK